MAQEDKRESTSATSPRLLNDAVEDPEDPAKPHSPNSPNGSSTRKIRKIYEFVDKVKLDINTANLLDIPISRGIRNTIICFVGYLLRVLACYAVLQSWVSKKFMTGCVVLFPVAVTFYITWWFIQFVDGFFSPIYERLGIDIFGLGFITSVIFIFFVGIFASSWLGASVFWIGEWFINRMPFVKHLYSASKQISSAISPDKNTSAFKEVAIIRHPRAGEYVFGFITSSVVLQRDNGDEELCSVYVPTNHLYIGDIYLLNSEEIIRPNLSVREGIEIIVSVGMSMPQVISSIERIPSVNDRIPISRMA